MIEIALSALPKLTEGRWLAQAPVGQARGVFIDSRKVLPGGIFVALPGEKVDGHDFCQSLEGQAAAVIVTRPVDTTLPQFLVPDAVRALADLGRYWRSQFVKPVIALTGSNGKTTTKNMIAAILSAAYPDVSTDASVLENSSLSEHWSAAQEKTTADGVFSSRVAVTQGNLNNHLGVPLTLFALEPEKQAAAVIEMGANHAGEIAYLTAIARPDIGLITNAGPAHLEGFGSLAGVAKSKGELFDFPLKTAIVNADDAFAEQWLTRAGKVAEKVWRCSFTDPSAEFFGQWQGDRLLLTTLFGRTEVSVQLLGKHNAFNALLASAAALAAGVPLSALAGLATLRPEPGRLQPIALAEERLLIHDAYNANPASVKAALAVLSEFANRPKYFVFGDMGEVGEGSAEAHREIGVQAQAAGLAALFTIGNDSRFASEAFQGNTLHFSTMEDFLHNLPPLPAAAVVLVKASRFMRLERAVDALQAAYALENK
jgi:UDP-N-acetylmuramoyl-tripeptide--D-alanyl-D-alanine ligase